jgi:HEAT repeat protein
MNAVDRRARARFTGPTRCRGEPDKGAAAAAQAGWLAPRPAWVDDARVTLARVRALRAAAALSVAAAALACSSARDGIASPDPARRAAAVASLAGSRDEADVPVLLVAQDDPSALVRKAAAGTFAARGGASSIEALGKLVRDPDPEVAAAAARGLSALPSERRARELLVEAFPGGGPAARAEIAAALQALGGSLREAVELEARLTWERNVVALGRGTPAERAGAAEELGRSGRAEAVRLLAPLLELERAEDPRVVAAAARALGAAGDRAARPVLEGLLEESPDAALAEEAAEALGALGDPAAADALARAGAGGAGRLGAAATDALAALPQAPEVAVALCQLALRSMDPAVARRAAAQARARESECPERPLLARLSRRGGDAIAALAALGELRLLPPALDAATARIQPLLASPDAALRAAAAGALGRMGAAKTAPALARRAADSAERLAKARAAPAAPGSAAAARAAGEELAAVIVALARLRGEGASALAAGRLADPDEGLRIAAVEALGEVARGDVGRIAPAVADASHRVRLAAVATLGRAGPQGVPALARAAAEAPVDDPGLCTALARALGETGSPEAVPALTALARGPAAATAAAALGRIGTKDATASLLDLLARPGLAGRAEALEALGALGTSEAGPAVAGELTSDRPELRAAAARAAGRLRHDPAAARLEALSSDYDGQVRRAAVEALAKLPTARAAR